MAYSCAYFKTADDSLDQAQQNKFDHLCRKLRLQKGEYLLDVGCGWGGLARFAAREYGARVFGITLSKEQLALGRERVAAEGLDKQVELQILDYRDLPQDGRFDKVVSVGMFEHVGHANLELYSQRLFGAVREGWPGDEPWHHRQAHRWPSGGARRRQLHRALCLPPWRVAASVDDHRCHQRNGAGGGGRGKPAPALRADPEDLERQPRVAACRGCHHGPGKGPAHLAPVPRRLLLCVLTRLDQPAPDPRRQTSHRR
ncbi:hypothetical protein L1887_51785 [Cichorium endivia]|nr:hypothetical protein L1887_51785 [Cichorium endivia]